MKALASLIGVMALGYAGTASAAPAGFTLANVLFRDNSAAHQDRHTYFGDYRRDGYARHHGNGYGHDHDYDHDHDPDHGGHGHDGHGHGPGHGGGNCHHGDCGPASP